MVLVRSLHLAGSFALLAALMLQAAPANAYPVHYQMRFTVDTGVVVSTTWDSGLTSATVHESDAQGNVYRGSFVVESDLLTSDGAAKPAAMLQMLIEIEDHVWGYNAATNNSLVGFRGPCEYGDACLGADSPGFDVIDGTVVNLTGGVFGLSDAPFVDFSFPGGPNTFDTLGHSEIQAGGTWSYLQGQGSMHIYQVPEPSILALLLAVLLGAALVRRAAWPGRSRGVSG